MSVFEIFTVIAIVGGFAVTWGVFKNKLENIENRVNTMEISGTPYARENVGQLQQTAKYHEQRLISAETKHDRVISTLEELKLALAKLLAKLDT